MASLQYANTVAGIIEFGKSQDISNSKLHFKNSFIDSNNNKIIVNFSSMLNKYSDYLKNITVTITFSNEEYNKYRFQPKLLSFDMYGTTEFWSEILRLNNLTSASQFTLKTLKMYTKDIFDVINEILILEDENIKKNNEDNNL